MSTPNLGDVDKLYVAFDGDSIGVKHGRALLADDPAEVRRVSSAIEAGEEVWRSWAIKTAGSLISAGGDEGMVEVSPDVIGEIPEIRKQYASAVGATCTVGVGRKMSEAAKALLVGKHRGKDRVVVYDDAMQPELDEIQGAKQTEDEKLNVYLAKSDDRPLWHLTENPNFQIDPQKHPTLAYGTGSPTKEPGLFVSHDPRYWRPFFDGHRDLYAARISPSPSVRNGNVQSHPEKFDPDPGRARVEEFLPIHEAVQKYPESFGSPLDWSSYVVSAWNDRKQDHDREELPRPGMEHHFKEYKRITDSWAKKSEHLAKDDGTGGATADHGRGVSRPSHDHSVQHDAPPAALQHQGPTAQDFHALAGRQEQADRAQQAQRGVDLDALRQQTAQALQAVKAQLPVIQQVGASYPETAKAVLGLTQAVTALARGVSDAAGAFQKAEPAHVWRDRDLRVPSLNHPDREAFEEVVAKAEAAEFCMGDVSAFAACEVDPLEIDYPEVPDDYRRDALWRDVAKAEALPPVVLEKTAAGYNVLHGVRRIRAAVQTRLSKVPALVVQREPDPSAPPPADKTLDKTVDGLPHHQAHRRLPLPVGAAAGGEVKVRHSTGKVGWRSVRAGMIQGSEDPTPLFGQNSHPVSSRRPSST